MRRIFVLLFALVIMVSVGCSYFDRPQRQVEVNAPPPSTTPTTLPKIEAEVSDAKDIMESVQRFMSAKKKRWQEDVQMQPPCEIRKLRVALRDIGNAKTRRAANIREDEYLAARKRFDAIWVTGLVKAYEAGAAIDSCLSETQVSGLEGLEDHFSIAEEIFDTLDNADGLQPEDVGLTGQKLRQMLRDGLKDELEVWRKGDGADTSHEIVVKGANKYSFHLEKDLGATEEEAKKLREKPE